VKIDHEALSAICSYCGLVDDRGGPVPLVRPLGDFESPSWDQMEFDAAVCRAGIKKFIRPLSAADQPAAPPSGQSFDGPFLLVEEFEPGVRLRRGVVLASSPEGGAAFGGRPSPRDRAALRRKKRRPRG
jgi:hypothetical protein